jgi:SAM-dependent methyltransferase
MSVKSSLAGAGRLMEALDSGNTGDLGPVLLNLADGLQETIGDSTVWEPGEVRSFTDFTKYVLIAVENGDFSFAAEVIGAHVIPLLQKVDVRSAVLKSSSKDSVTSAVQEQYTDFMYPDEWRGVIPQEVRTSPLRATAVYSLDYIEHMCFPRFKRHHELQVLIAGCGTGESACRCAMQFPDAHFVWTDISPTSLQRAEQYARELALDNVELRLADIMTMDLGETFDIIMSSGVTHHLSEPSAGVANLSRHLNDGGALAAMVYGEYGRFEIGLFQDAVRTVLGSQMNFRNGIELAEAFLEEIDLSNRLPNIAWKHELSGGENHMVDLLLNVNEHRYNVRSLSDMVEAGGMRIVDFIANLSLNPDKYVKSDKLKAQFEWLTYLDRCRLAEAISGRISKLHFLAAKQTNEDPMPSPADDAFPTYLVFRSPFLLEGSFDTNLGPQHYLELDVSCIYEPATASRQPLLIDESIKHLLSLCDGRGSVQDICRRMPKSVSIPAAQGFIRSAVQQRYLFLHLPDAETS